MRKLSSQAMFIALWLLCFSAVAIQARVGAATTPEQRKAVNEYTTTMRKIHRLAETGKTREALTQFEALHAAITKTAGEKPDPDLITLLAPVLKLMSETAALLELEGLKVPEPLTFAAPEKPMPAPGGTPAPIGDGKVSFSKHVAPILSNKCGRCHIDDAKGKVKMSTFAELMKGSETDGVIIQVGSGKGSRLIEVIESGDMPRGGAKISADELALLSKWIDEGAVNDAESENAVLRQLAMTARAEMPKVTVEKATGSEKVKFGLHIAPVLVAECIGCHGARQPAGGLSMLTFAALIGGGDSGAPVLPGQAQESLLIQKLKGAGGVDRMPLRKPPLSDEVISQFETWIKDGARFDGDAEDLPIVRVAAVSLARSQTPAELSKDRVGFTARNWHLAIPDDKSAVEETKNFLLTGNVGSDMLKQVAEIAEAQLPKVLTSLNAKPTEPLLKGRLTIYVMANRYDYAEFGTMIEQRSVPKEWRGHWKYDIVDPYIVLLKPSSSDNFSLNALLAQQIASVFIAGKSDGKGPRWLAEGTGRALAAKMDPKDSRILSWDAEIPDALSRMQSPEDFMNGKLGPEDSDVLSFSFMRLMMTKSKNFGQLISAVSQGMPVDQALARAYGATPAQLAGAWVPLAVKK
jgi:mono/diheme cytochrome c family protein